MSPTLCSVSFARSVFAIGTLFIAGCGSNGQSVDPGTLTQTVPSKITVVLDSSAVTIDLNSLATTQYKGAALVLLSNVWTAAAFSVDRTTLGFGFEADDGFTPASKGCADLPGVDLEKGYIDPASRNLTWDESLGLRGCYSVTGTNKMTGGTPAADAGADGG